MSIWRRLLNWIGLRPKSGSHTYEISESLQVTLSTIAQHEGRPVHELLPDLVAAGLKLGSIIMFNIKADVVASSLKLPKDEAPLFIMQLGYVK